MSGWATATINFNREVEESKIKEQIADKVAGGQIFSRRKEGTYLDYTIWGYDGAGKAREIAKQVAEDGDEVVIIEANDTSDSGRGVLYEMNGGELEKVDEWGGYEGAKGRDVVGYMAENHNVSSVARPIR